MRSAFPTGVLCSGALALASLARGAEPIAYHASYELSIESATFTLSYDWSEFDHHAWSFDRGSYTERLMTDYCFARRLTPTWAVIVRLPKSFTNNSNPTPEIILLDPKDTTLIRCYKDIEPGKAIDGLFSLRKFAMTSEPGKKVDGQMSAQERRLIREVDQGKYATLYGCSYERSQWEQSAELSLRLAGLRETTLLGHPATKTKPDGLPGFYEFTSRFVWNGKKGVMKPLRVLFGCRDGVWTESNPNLAIYRRGQFLRAFEVFAPYLVDKMGLRFNLQDDSLYYDADAGRLTFLLGRVLESLTQSQFENPPGPM